jgi:aminopeptidase N
LKEIFSNEVSRQWWGNIVGPSSFHDEWLSLGFADFSAAIYQLESEKSLESFRTHWRRDRGFLLGKNAYGIRANEAGPLWLGLLNDTYRTQGAGRALSAFKGGFVLHMLRCLMFDTTSGDTDFIATMHDFVQTFGNRTASTEDFQGLVEKHMKPFMNLGGNGRMDWFFREWVYGTDIPNYRLEYSLSQRPDGKWLMAGKLTQSGVADGFRMRVPVYVELGGKTVPTVILALGGNTSRDFEQVLPARPTRVLLNPNYEVLTDRQEVVQTGLAAARRP